MNLNVNSIIGSTLAIAVLLSELETKETKLKKK